jgi:subtilisin family serine protease
MKKLTLIIFVLVGAVLLGTANFLVFSDVSASLSKSEREETFPFEGEYKEDELLIKYKNPAESLVVATLGEDKAELVNDKGLLKIKKEDSETLNDLYQRLKDEPNISYIEPNYKIKMATTIPNDTYFSSQWNLTKIKASQGWDYEQGDSSVAIGVIDSGINYSHNDLSAKIWNNSGETGSGKETNGVDDDGNGYIDDWRGWDFVNFDNNATDDQGHGTSVSGIAAASTNNSTGVSGIDWSAKIVPLKVLDSDGSGYVEDLILAIDYASDKGIDVVNMSLGSYSTTQALENSIEAAYANDVVMTAASGNNDLDIVLYPARYSEVIAVGATNQSDERCDVDDWGYDGYGYPQGSNYGPEVDVAAPGVDLYSTHYSGVNAYTSGFGGTSGATPHVSGLAALIKAKYPTLTNEEVYDHIRYTSDDLGSGGFDNYYGFGRINLEKALSIDLNVLDYTDLAQRMNPNINTLNWQYWWDWAVPNNTTYRQWFFENIIPSDSALFSRFWDSAVPYDWSEGYYHDYFWDNLVPTKAVASYYHDKFWDSAVPNGWANNYYFSTLWDSAVPNKWAASYYVGKLWDYAIPNQWANKFYFTNFWSKFVPNGWSGNYYKNTFWGSAVKNMWTSGYYYSTTKYKAIPNKWANGYYKYMP